MEGRKVLGFWGAIHPWQEGVITAYDESTHEVLIAWDDGLAKYAANARDIKTSSPMSEGVGLYFIES